MLQLTTILTDFKVKYRSLINIIRSLAPALPLDDADAKRTVTRYPLKGQPHGKSFFQRELEVAQREGNWVPKLYLLPDVGRFSIKLRAYNAALLANGIIGRYPSEIHLFANRNRRMNRYLLYSYYKLFSLKGNSNAFWHSSIRLIRNSSSYLATCMYTVDTNLYRKLTMRNQYKLLQRINLMRANMFLKKTNWQEDVPSINAFRHYVKFYRVYIPKGDTWRPLGVPVRAWRIYQKLWIVPIMGFTGVDIPSSFHGYIPTRGTGTAWKQILTSVIHKQSIFEIDFKGFFPSIDTTQLSTLLYMKAGIPASVVRYLHLMNNSLPMFEDTDLKLAEIRWTQSHQNSLFYDQVKVNANRPYEKEDFLSGFSAYVSKTGLSFFESKPDLRPYSFYADTIFKGADPYHPDAPEMFLKDPDLLSGSGFGPVQNLTSDTDLQEMFKEFWYGPIGGPPGIGLPQGATVSPYLSILYLAYVLELLKVPKDNYLFYADDGIFFSDSHSDLDALLTRIFSPERKPGTLAYYGIIFHPEKSGWVKIMGEWVKRLKFLGLVFLPGKTLADSILHAETRPRQRDLFGPLVNSTLVFDKTKLVFYDYTTEMLNLAVKYGSKFLDMRYKAARTEHTKSYWWTLSSGRKIGFFPGPLLDYIYLLSRLSSSSVSGFVLFFMSGSYTLTDHATLRYHIERFFSEEKASTFIKGLENADSVLTAVQWLKGGYEDSTHQLSASTSLLNDLEKLPFIPPQVGLIDKKYDIVDRLSLITHANKFFLGWMEPEKLNVLRDVGLHGRFNKGPRVSSPLDLLRFFWTLFGPLLMMFGTPMEWSQPNNSQAKESKGQKTT